MGLDMYAFSMSNRAVIDDFSFDQEFKTQEIAYWRKHNALHGWMEALYRQKGGNAKEFNCIPLRLTKEDMEQLILDINADTIKPTAGFFFGSTEDYYDSDMRERDIRFANQVMSEIDNGRAVYYDSWW